MIPKKYERGRGLGKAVGRLMGSVAGIESIIEGMVADQTGDRCARWARQVRAEPQALHLRWPRMMRGATRWSSQCSGASTSRGNTDQ